MKPRELFCLSLDVGQKWFDGGIDTRVMVPVDDSLERVIRNAARAILGVYSTKPFRVHKCEIQFDMSGLRVEICKEQINKVLHDLVNNVTDTGSEVDSYPLDDSSFKKLSGDTKKPENLLSQV